MSRLQWVFLSAVIAVLVLVVAQSIRSGGEDASPPPGAKAVADGGRVGDVAQMASADPASVLSRARPGPEIPEIKALQASADSGQLDAQQQLARLLIDCAAFVPASSAQFEEAIIELGASPLPLLALFSGQKNELRAVQLLLEVQEAQELRCGSHDLPPVDQRLPLAREWLERAAGAGHLLAKLDWVSDFRVRWSNPVDVVREAELVRVERERALGYLRDALAGGLDEALLAQSLAHRSGDLAELDPVKAYAYWLAWRQRGSPGLDLPEWALQSGDDSGPRGLDTAQSRTAEFEARALVERFSR